MQWAAGGQLSWDGVLRVELSREGRSTHMRQAASMVRDRRQELRCTQEEAAKHRNSTQIRHAMARAACTC